MDIYTVSQARENLYDLVKRVSQGLKSYEIRLRGSKDSAVLINKSELESWQETLDILSNADEIKSIRKARKEKKTISHKSLLNDLGFAA